MMRRLIFAALGALALTACGKANDNDAQAQTQTQTQLVTATAKSAPSNVVSADDKAAILAANHLTANRLGLVRNECGDMVTPQFIAADVGLGNTILFVMVGGPEGGYTCYGDGPDLHLMKKDGAAWREIYANRGGAMIILPTLHSGAHDLAFGGPGISHARYRWTGSTYAQAGDVADDQIGNAPMLPND